MVSEYFGKKLTLDEIKSYYNTEWNRPIYTTELAFILNKIGLNTKIYTSNLDYDDTLESKVDKNKLSDIFIEEKRISTIELANFLNTKTIIIVLLEYGVLFNLDKK